MNTTMQNTKAQNIDEYIARFPKKTQEYLTKIRLTIKRLVPEAEERISYQIPAFNLNGKYLIYFAGFHKHVSMYPAPRGSENFQEELSHYKGGKGTVQFPLDRPLPVDLIKRIIKFKIDENLKMTKNKK